MDSFYGRIQNLFKEVVSKNDAIIDLVEQFQKKSDTEFSQLQTESLAAKNDALQKLEAVNSELTAKCASYESQKTALSKQIEDLEFEVKNLKSVSLLSQADKYSRTLQIKVEELEKKLKISETKCKSLEERLTALQSPAPVEAPSPVKPDTQVAESVVVQEIADAISTVEVQMTRCYARIGSDKLSPTSLTAEEISQYPVDSYKSKSGKYIGRACTKLVSEHGLTFCADHTEGFSDIRQEPVETEKPKKKKKAASASVEESKPVHDSVITGPASVTVKVDEPSEPVIEPQPSASAELASVVTSVEPAPASTEPASVVTSVEPASAPASAEPEKETKKVKKPKKTDEEKAEKKSKKKKSEKTESNEVSAEEKKPEIRSPPKTSQFKLVAVESGIKSPAKPDWAFIEPWDEPETGVQYIIDTRSGFAFEATETGDIGGFTGFKRV